MNIEYVKTSNNDMTIIFQGELDALGCIEVRTDMEKIVSTNDKKNIAIDMSNVSFIDSSGIGMIVFLYKRVKANQGTLQIINVQGQPQELMELLRIDSAIPVSTLTDKNLTAANNA